MRRPDLRWLILVRRPVRSGRRSIVTATCSPTTPAAATQAVTLALELPEAHFVVGLAHTAIGRPDRAAAALRQCLGLAPGRARAALALGNALIDLDRLREAEEYLRHAIARDPTLPEAHASLGLLLSATGRLDEAIMACDAAIALRPDFACAYWNKSVAQLLGGDLAQCWENYEWRKRHDRFARDFPALLGREWLGESLEGQTLLVHAEQGLGDTIQFARYLPLLAAQGAAVVLACAAPLIPLLADVPGVAAVVPKDATLPPYDLWADQMSLPRLFGTRIDSIPAALGYLRAAPALIARRTPPPSRQARVGIVWAGNPAHHNDRRRSLSTAALAPLLATPGVAWISLQKGPRSLEITLQHGIPDQSRGLTDFAETAALIATLDLVIAVDTATAHLAGALGRPVWLMLPHAPDWRWLTGRADSPWYASMTLFRQSCPGGWAGVIDRVAAETVCPRTGPPPGGRLDLKQPGQSQRSRFRSARAVPPRRAATEPVPHSPSSASRSSARA
ncbi:MAG TPA: tetratricopeptide repeat-containing glycosyltransferase family protein [Acetobacteraceae bacterium]|jgi:tetratricopeptide (TPR) repeat protein